MTKFPLPSAVFAEHVMISVSCWLAVNPEFDAWIVRVPDPEVPLLVYTLTICLPPKPFRMMMF